MTKKMIVALTVIGAVSFLWAEDDVESPWTKSVLGGINMTQTGFDNWVAGGESAFAWQMSVDYKFIRESEKVTFSNSGRLAYGGTKMAEDEMRKSVDEIKLESVMTYKLGAAANPFVAVTGESQFAAGYAYDVEPVKQISAFWDPGYLRESIGAGFDLREGIKTRLGVALKQTLTSDYNTPYADDPDTDEIEQTKNEFGFESVTDIVLKISESSVYTSKVEIFSALNSIEETDVKWDNVLVVKVSEYINMNMNVKLLYDSNLSAKRQLKQAMAIGFNYAFI